MKTPTETCFPQQVEEFKINTKLRGLFQNAVLVFPELFKLLNVTWEDQVVMD